ncbi:hypothetical protein [Burkholderia mayonis]|uniref:hypothetical protein n=1 Tax=Burkholderia mayonis TaxID=1385591 RepID=UPI00131F10A5|nr:hypothetical protein [Burkholderia mayonis]
MLASLSLGAVERDRAGRPPSRRQARRSNRFDDRRRADQSHSPTIEAARFERGARAVPDRIRRPYCPMSICKRFPHARFQLANDCARMKSETYLSHKYEFAFQLPNKFKFMCIRVIAINGNI